MALQIKFGNRSRKLFPTTLPDFAAPIWLRGGTTDFNVFSQVLVAKEYDISETPQGQDLSQRYEAFIASGVEPLIIDCGANIGLSSIWYARHFPAAKIISVEPDQSNLEIARKNLQAYRNVELVHGGVWDSSTHFSIANRDAESWAFQIKEGDGPIPGFSIDQLSQDRPILIVKVDIEGAELALFRSNTDWMNRTDLIAIELHDWLFPNSGTSQSFIRAIAAHPHQIAMRGENLFFLRDRDCASI